VQVPPRTPLAPVVETLLPLELKPLVPAVLVQGLLGVLVVVLAARLKLLPAMEMPARHLAAAAVVVYNIHQRTMEPAARAARVKLSLLTARHRS
jgi:hypothetical protein